MTAVTPASYHECMGCTHLVQKIIWLNWMKVTWRSPQTAFVHTELTWPLKVMVWSWLDFGMLLVWFRKVTLFGFCVHFTVGFLWRILFLCLWAKSGNWLYGVKKISIKWPVKKPISLQETERRLSGNPGIVSFRQFWVNDVWTLRRKKSPLMNKKGLPLR